MTKKEINALGSPDRFGSNWKKFSSIDSIYEEQFLEWIVPLTKKSFKDKLVLDAGCGIGRNTMYALNYGAIEAYLFDYESSTVNIARNNLKNYKNVKIFQDSIYEMSKITNSYFDIVMCIGVIHHLAKPQEAIEKLYEKLSENGKLLIWVYGYEGNEFLLKLLLPIRIITSKLPYLIVSYLGKLMTVFLFLILKIYKTKSPYWKRAKKMNFKVLEQILVDQLIPKIAIYYKKNELNDLFKNINYKKIEINHTNKNSWTILITK